MMRWILVAVAALAVSACNRGGEKADPAAAAAAQANSQPTPEGQAFLDKTAKEAGVQSTPSGLLYKVVRSGPATGLKPQAGDEVKVHYEGKLIDGQVFDSSYERGQPAAMPLEGLVPAWQEALPMMRPGDEWVLYVPPKLGYGAEGTPGGPIPPNAVLVFRVELIGVLAKPSRIQQG